MLTKRERARLEGFENETDKQQIKPEHRRYNDMVTRNKIRQWMKDSEDVLFAINKLSTKQVRTLASDKLIYNLGFIADAFLDALEFARIEGNSVEEAIAIKAVKNIETNKWEPWARKAEEKDFERNAALYMVISALNFHTSYPEPEPALKEYMLKTLNENRP